MTTRLALLAVGAVFALPSVAAAQGDDDEWAAGLGGHLAFLTQSQDDGVSMFQMIGPDGQRSAQAPISSGYASPVVAVGPRGDAIFLWFDRDERLWARYRSVGGVLGADEFVADTVGAGSEVQCAGAGRGRHRDGHLRPGSG